MSSRYYKIGLDPLDFLRGGAQGGSEGSTSGDYQSMASLGAHASMGADAGGGANISEGDQSVLDDIAHGVQVGTKALSDLVNRNPGAAANQVKERPAVDASVSWSPLLIGGAVIAGLGVALALFNRK